MDSALASLLVADASVGLTRNTVLLTSASRSPQPLETNAQLARHVSSRCSSYLPSANGSHRRRPSLSHDQLLAHAYGAVVIRSLPAPSLPLADTQSFLPLANGMSTWNPLPPTSHALETPSHSSYCSTSGSTYSSSSSKRGSVSTAPSSHGSSSSMSNHAALRSNVNSSSSAAEPSTKCLNIPEPGHLPVPEAKSTCENLMKEEDRQKDKNKLPPRSFRREPPMTDAQWRAKVSDRTGLRRRRKAGEVSYTEQSGPLPIFFDGQPMAASMGMGLAPILEADRTAGIQAWRKKERKSCSTAPDATPVSSSSWSSANLPVYLDTTHMASRLLTLGDSETAIGVHLDDEQEARMNQDMDVVFRRRRLAVITNAFCLLARDMLQ